MPEFIYLMNLTDQGIKGVKEAPKRREAAQKMIADLGGSIVNSYLTMGMYDRILIVDFPDGEAAAKCALGFGRTGNMRTTTLRGFNDEDSMRIINDVP